MKEFAMPDLAPPFMPPKRIAEARAIATGGEWFAGCPEARCRAEGRCSGALRRFHAGGARCYPTCLKVVLEALLAGDACGEPQNDAMQAILARDEGYWAAVEKGGDRTPADTAVLLLFMTALAEPIGESRVEAT
jgi:hypothetical protein